MTIKTLLLKKRSPILRRWFDAVLEMYPAETVRFIKNRKEQFTNPVGHTIYQGIEGIFDEIASDRMNPERVNAFLDNIIRVRAVQDFPPSQALSFVFLLKEVIREELGDEFRAANMMKELLILESQIDALARTAFDIYMQCREKIYELRTNEMNRWTERLLRGSLHKTRSERGSEKDQ
jgi:hypothetical protein